MQTQESIPAKIKFIWILPDTLAPRDAYKKLAEIIKKDFDTEKEKDPTSFTDLDFLSPGLNWNRTRGVLQESESNPIFIIKVSYVVAENNVPTNLSEILLSTEFQLDYQRYIHTKKFYEPTYEEI